MMSKLDIRRMWIPPACLAVFVGMLLGRAGGEDSTDASCGVFSAHPLSFLAEGAYGYREVDGRVVVAPKFSGADDTFSDGVAAVGKWPEDGSEESDAGELLWGYADLAGELVVSPRFAGAQPFSEGLGAVRDSQGRWGFVSRSGRVAISPRFELADGFHEGLAAACRDDKWGFVDVTGTWVIQPQFAVVGHFCEGLAIAGVAGEIPSADQPTERILWGFIDTQGEFRVPPRFSCRPTRFSEGLAGVKLEGSWGFVDHRGKLMIPGRFCEARRFSEGVAAVRVAASLGYAWGFIDKVGNWVIPPRFQRAESFSAGFAAVRVQGKWGLINHAGQYAVVPEHRDVFGFVEGYARLYTFLNGEIWVDSRGHRVVKVPDDPSWADNFVRQDDEIGLRIEDILRRHGKPDAESEFIAKQAHTPPRQYARDHLPEAKRNQTVKHLVYAHYSLEKGKRLAEVRHYWFVKDHKGVWRVIANVFKPKYSSIF